MAHPSVAEDVLRTFSAAWSSVTAGEPALPVTRPGGITQARAGTGLP